MPGLTPRNENASGRRLVIPRRVKSMMSTQSFCPVRAFDRDEGRGGELVGVEDVGCPQVLVAVPVAGVQPTRPRWWPSMLGVPFSGTVIAPEKSPNRPRTLPTIRWRTENVMEEWTGSIVHVPGVRSCPTADVHLSVLLEFGRQFVEIAQDQGIAGLDEYATLVDDVRVLSGRSRDRCTARLPRRLPRSRCWTRRPRVSRIRVGASRRACLAAVWLNDLTTAAPGKGLGVEIGRQAVRRGFARSWGLGTRSSRRRRSCRTSLRGACPTHGPAGTEWPR